MCDRFERIRSEAATERERQSDVTVEGGRGREIESVIVGGREKGSVWVIR